MKIPSLFFALALLVPLFPGRAEVTVNLAAEPPASDVVILQTQTDAGLGWRNETSEGRRDLGQSFRAPRDFDLDAVTFRLNGNVQPGLPGAEFTLTVYSVATAGSGPGSRQPLSVQQGHIPRLPAGRGLGEYLTFQIDPVSLRAGEFYLVMLALAEPGPQRSLVLEATTREFAEGAAYEDKGDGIKSFNADLVFYLQATP